MFVVPPHRRWHDVSLRTVHIVLALVIVVIVGVVMALAQAGWVADTERASIEASNLAVLVEQDIRRNVELYDQAIQGTRDALLDPSVMTAPEALRNRVLFDRAGSALYVGEMMVLDSNGAIVASSSPHGSASSDSADRDYFRIHVATPWFGLYVSRPLVLRPGDEPVIALSRRITRPDGSFGGVVVGTLRVEYLHQLFQKMRIGPHGAITLYRSDGSVMMREPFVPAILGVRRIPQALLNLASRATGGEYQTASPIDGEWRMFHFRRLTALPLIVNVGLSLRDIHRDWGFRMVLIGVVIVLCCGSIIVVTLRLGRELRRRIEAEAALLALVDTDGLTGLANRRCFDRVLAEAWRSQEASGAPLSLLMIDADRFKLFNDTLGHAAGDAALRQIGHCLMAHAYQPGHLAARFGGEEFALVLPGCGRTEALRVADIVRRSIEHLGIDYPAAPLGHLTVSIGCATADVGTMRDRQDLLIAADAALYRSKHMGRNRVHGHGADPGILPLAS